MEELFVKNSFTDLNVVVQEGWRINRDTLDTLIEYGYEVVALNKEVTLAKKTPLNPPPALLSIIDVIPVSRRKKPMKILRRLTVVVEDASLLHALSSPSLESYDLLAIRPANDKIFQQACGTLSIDIISVDLSERVPFTFKQAQIGLAIERGIHFEVCYSPAIRDATARRNTLANALELIKVSKGKNIIVSSQAEKAFDLRAPADVTNLCHLFGCPSPLCRATITSNCRAVLLHAATRRKTAKGVVSSSIISSEPSDNRSIKKSKGITDTKKSSESLEAKNCLKRKRARDADSPAVDVSLPPAKLKNDSSIFVDSSELL